MRLTTLVTFGVMAAALGLSACGGSGSSAFAGKVKESCEKSPQGATLDCACIASTLDKELDDKTKAVMVAIEAATTSGKSPVDAMKEAGVSEAEGPALMSKLTPALAKAAQECGKKT